MKFSPPQPIFRSFDEAKFREFYLDYLGFQVDWEHRFGPDAPLYVQISMGDAVLHLTEHHGDATPGGSIRIRTGGLEDYHKTLQAKGYRYANPGLQDQSWGCRELIITDPFGNKIVFFADLPPTDQAQSDLE